MSTFSVVTKSAIAICDAINAIKASEKVQENEQSTSMTDKAFLVNRIALLGLSCAEAGGLILGMEAKSLNKMKSIEVISRMLELPFRVAKEGEEYGSFNTVSDRIRFFEKIIIAPMSDIIRVSAEQSFYQEKTYLEMSPEERANTKRPIYEYSGEELELKGYKPIDIQECKEMQEADHYISQQASVLRIVSEMEIASTLSSGSLYEKLASYMQKIKRVFRGEEQVEMHEVFDILALPVIPEVLHGDAIFKKYICPITQDPIRHPVLDPNGKAIYERDAIKNWLQVSQTSPVTRQPLTSEELQELPAIQALIDSRLRHHQESLWDYVANSSILEGKLNSPIEGQDLLERANSEMPNL